MGKTKSIRETMGKLRSKVRSKILRGIEKMFNVHCIEPYMVPTNVIMQNVQLETINGGNEVRIEAYSRFKKDIKQEIAMKIGKYLEDNGFLRWEESSKYSPYSHDTMFIEATLKAVKAEKSST